MATNKGNSKRARSVRKSPAKEVPIRGLNPEQKKAVTTLEGPVLVLAGAGTGKTRVITVRMAHLIANGVAPENLLAMTFTNKAAREMRERVGDLVGSDAASELTIGTFHAFCVKVLRNHARSLGLSVRFTIADAADQISAVRSAMREVRVAETRLEPRALQSRISLLKNRMQATDSFLESAKDSEDELVGRVWRRYDEYLRRSNRVDFDDLLLLTVKLLKENAKVRKKLRDQFRYLLVDEYQDTNAPQYEIVRGIGAEHRNVCVVGDDDQSIYGWRGADVRKILGFEQDFPGAVVVKLETNYRSTTQILRAAQRVIDNNPKRHEKTLRSAIGSGEAVRAMQVDDEAQEAELVVREILDLVKDRQARFSDFAILFRTQVQPRTFEAELRARDVPYVLVGGMSFFDRKEVRDVLAFLRIAANPDDEPSLLRVINCPPRGIGKSSIERVLEFAAEHGLPLAEAFTRGSEIEGLNPASVEAFLSFRDGLARLGKKDPGSELVTWLQKVLTKTDYRSEVDRIYPDAKTREDRWSGVSEVFNLAENYVSKASKPTLSGFLEGLALSEFDDRPAKDDRGAAVTLMTLHSAKGLEFERVYLVGMEEGILPHARSVAEDTIEEERRLAYVGITRARQHLTVTLTRDRARYGQRVVSMPSRFLYEMKGEAPPTDWIPAGAPPDKKAAQKAKGKKRRKKARRKIPPGLEQSHEHDKR